MGHVLLINKMEIFKISNNISIVFLMEKLSNIIKIDQFIIQFYILMQLFQI